MAPLEHPPDRDETEAERFDRNLNELLGEVRATLPGVQVLFAFLLTVPFAVGFRGVTDFQRDVYFATLMLTGIATVLLIGPSAYHRINFRRGDKEHIVDVSNAMLIAGIAVLGLAMAGAVLLVTDVLFSPATAVVATAGLGLFALVLWFGAPLWRRRRTGV